MSEAGQFETHGGQAVIVYTFVVKTVEVVIFGAAGKVTSTGRRVEAVLVAFRGQIVVSVVNMVVVRRADVGIL